MYLADLLIGTRPDVNWQPAVQAQTADVEGKLP